MQHMLATFPGLYQIVADSHRCTISSQKACLALPVLTAPLVRAERFAFRHFRLTEPPVLAVCSSRYDLLRHNQLRHQNTRPIPNEKSLFSDFQRLETATGLMAKEGMAKGEQKDQRIERPASTTHEDANAGLLIEAEIISNIRDRERCLDFLKLICCGFGKYATNTALIQQVWSSFQLLLPFAYLQLTCSGLATGPTRSFWIITISSRHTIIDS